MAHYLFLHISNPSLHRFLFFFETLATIHLFFFLFSSHPTSSPLSSPYFSKKFSDDHHPRPQTRANRGSDHDGGILYTTFFSDDHHPLSAAPHPRAPSRLQHFSGDLLPELDSANLLPTFIDLISGTVTAPANIDPTIPSSTIRRRWKQQIRRLFVLRRTQIRRTSHDGYVGDPRQYQRPTGSATSNYSASISGDLPLSSATPVTPQQKQSEITNNDSSSDLSSLRLHHLQIAAIGKVPNSKSVSVQLVQFLKMPRRPTKRRQPLGTQPLTFSSFARASCMVRNQMLRSKCMKSHPKHEGNGFIRNSPEAQSESSDSSSSDEEFEEIQADFEFFDPKPDDFHGVKTLLQNYLDDTQWDLSGFSDLILGQTTVGTVVKVEGDEDNGVFSFITALNLERYKDSRCIQELKEYLLKVCQQKDVKNDLKVLLEEQASSVGLIVSQRMVNLPPQLLPPLYDALFDEISWAIEDEPTKELQDSFRFKTYILVSKIYKLKNPNHKKRPTSETDESIIYVKPEDEIFDKLCLWSFCFPLHIQPQTTNETKGYQLLGLVMAVEATKIPKFREELKSLISEA